MMKALRNTALAIGIVALVIAAITFALDRSLPYRIGPANYTRYLWVGRLSIASLIVCVLAIGLGITSRQRLPIILGAGSIVGFIVAIGGPHAGTDPKIWCYFNLRRIDNAKESLVQEKSLTNGFAITAEELSPQIEDGFRSLKCYERGVYIVGPVGTEPRCSFHGSQGQITGDTPRKAE